MAAFNPTDYSLQRHDDRVFLVRNSDGQRFGQEDSTGVPGSLTAGELVRRETNHFSANYGLDVFCDFFGMKAGQPVDIDDLTV